MLERVLRAQSKRAAQDVALSRRKQGFESPRERNNFKELSSRGILEGVTYGINTAYPLMIEAEWWSPSPTVLANQIQPLTAPRPPLIRSKPDDHPRALPQGDGIAGPAFAGGAESGEHNLVVLDRRRARRCFPRWRSTYRRGR